ncbi:MAG: hypothetical protein ACK4F5_04585 [Aliihoeflea sp.]
MNSTAFQLIGLLIILAGAALVWMLDLYGCSFNTNGCSRFWPQLTEGLVWLLVLPVGIGTALILHGRRLR